MRVMVVDGQVVPRRMAAKLIRDCGVADVLEAESGDQALAMLAKDAAIDLVVTDIRLEGMDGVTFVRRIAEQSLATHLLLISNVDEPLARTVMALARSLNLDAAGHIRKPATPETLRACVQRLLVRRAASPILGARAIHVTAEELRQAIALRQFVPYFQPRLRGADGSLTAVEALIRWQHPQRGLIPPGAFIPLADSAGLIDGITGLVLEMSLAWARRWHEAGVAPSISVNLTETALKNAHLPNELLALADEYGIPPARILLEVTESDAITEAPAALETLARLRLMEFGLSIDDFGTGVATPDQLAAVPFTEAKIDQSLVTGVSDQPQYVGVLAQTLRQARDLGLKTVAEGVESKADWELLNELGCDEMQGFYVARPMPGEEIEGWALGWHRQPL
ncbi:EAL domain-containing protein (putative c-di-GMP-specific phosphodiesterase class I) [Dongia mobilis]|uniref:EAL domain-containing protein (Putative c-di-GMP-specific phosphodiesterase class I) n=1 Tax=Dongia mobilis TaxID=578943 RepID=A0A4R6WYE5_9PROT|nr:EAL domain-containing response regulator [Dongia mobilis]TDQ84463.1 EAL domain-containing protein (putative c-di-GMP-specific phosphodiesterase class I) [Dongia mobilis]